MSSKHSSQHCRNSILYFITLLLTRSLKIFLFLPFEKNVRCYHGPVSGKYVFSYAVKDLTPNNNKKKNSIR